MPVSLQNGSELQEGTTRVVFDYVLVQSGGEGDLLLLADAPQRLEGADEDLAVRDRHRRVGQFAGTERIHRQHFVLGIGREHDRLAVRLAAKNADGDAKADLAVGSGEGSPANVRVYLGKNFTGGGEPSTF